MKRTTHYIAACCAAMLIVSCVADIEPYAKGWLVVGRPTVDFTTETRTGEEGTEQQPEEHEPEIDYWVSIKQGAAIIHGPERYSDLKGKEIPLAVGDDYTLYAENCTKKEAETMPTNYGQPRYVGQSEEPFAIEANKPNKQTVKCSMANAALIVKTDESFENLYASFEVTATSGNRSLTFTDETTTGYFNMGTDDTLPLTYSVTATPKDNNGEVGTGGGPLTLKARTRTTLTLKADALGTVNLVVTYDPTFTPGGTTVLPIPDNTTTE